MKKLLVILSALILTACGGGGGSSSTTTPPPVTQPTTYNACQTSASPTAVSKIFGTLNEESDVWNAAGASAYSVCMNNTLDANNNVTDLEVDWNVTSANAANPAVVAYPNVMFGWQTGYTSSTTTVLPASVANVPSLPLTGPVTTTCNGTCAYDTSFDLMFSNTATPSMWPPQAEVMVYLSNANKSLGTVTDLGAVTIDGVVFETYTGSVTVNGSTWPILTYVAQTTPTNMAGLNMKDFVQDAVTHGTINTSMYLDMVELGSEVLSGSGTTSIKGFTIQ
jgi:hypothetical protein